MKWYDDVDHDDDGGGGGGGIFHRKVQVLYHVQYNQVYVQNTL
jgi:hypothetical protein